jgi:hypothetical protein
MPAFQTQNIRMKKILPLLLLCASFFSELPCCNAQTFIAGEQRTPRLYRFIKGNNLGQVMPSSDGERVALVNDEKLYTWDLNTIDSGYYYYGYQEYKEGMKVLSPNLKWYAVVYAPFTSWPSGQKKGKTQEYNVRLKTTDMKKVQYSFVPATEYEFVETMFPVAITNDGKIISADVDFSYTKPKYEQKKGSLKSFKNLYIGDPVTGKTQLIYTGKLVEEAKSSTWNITPDGSKFVIWVPQTRILTSIDLATGERKDFNSSTTMDLRYLFKTMSDNDAVFVRPEDSAASYVWIDLKSGKMTAPRTLPAQSSMQFVGGEAWMYNVKNDMWTILKRQGDSIAIRRTVPMDRYAMGLPSTGHYQFVVMKGEKVIGFPTSAWNSYGRDMSKVAIVSYDLQKRSVDKMHYEVFASYYSSDGNANPVASSVSSQPVATNTATPVSADCAQKIKSLSYPIGSKFTVSGSLTENWYEIIITGYDCGTNQYIAARRKFTDSKKSFFKTDDNISFYTVERVTYPLSTSFSTLQRDNSLYEICSLCAGASIVNEEVVHTRGGKWEQVNFNIEVYTPLHVIASWKERAECPKCKHTGLVKK